MTVHLRNNLVDRGCFIHAHGSPRHDGIDPQGLRSFPHELTLL